MPRLMSVSLTESAVVARTKVIREGFPDMTPREFVEFFCAAHKGCLPSSTVTRIEWKYLDA